MMGKKINLVRMANRAEIALEFRLFNHVPILNDRMEDTGRIGESSSYSYSELPLQVDQFNWSYAFKTGSTFGLRHMA